MNTVRCRKQTCISKIEGVGTIKDTNIDMERDAQTPLRRSCRIRLSRNDLITCLNYGRDRKSVFPEYYFCGKCDNWEIFVDTNTVGAKKRHSQRNKCQSSHQNPSHPTTLKKNVIQGYLMQLDHSKSDIDNEEDSDHTTIGESTDESSNATDRESCKYDRTDSSGNHNNHALSIEQINADGTADKAVLENSKNADGFSCVNCQTFMHEAMALHRRVDTLNKELIMLSSKPAPDDEIATIANAVNSLFPSKKRRGVHRRVQRRLANALVSKLYDNPLIQNAMDDIVYKTIQKHFSPFRILKLMDRNGGKLNLEAISLLRSLEIDENTQLGRRQNTILPSEHALKAMTRLVQEAGSHVAPFKMGQTDNNQESVEFSPQHVVTALLKATRMDEVDTSGENREVKLSQAIDGSRFSTNLQFVMYGIKLSDPRAKCPWNKTPLFNPRGETTLQSRNNQVPLKIVLGSESDAMYAQFSDLFRNVFEYDRFIIGEEQKEVLVNIKNVCLDMKASWTGLKRGGACKVKKYFCHCCTVTSNFAATKNQEKCTRWCSARPDDWSCYHTRFLTQEVQLEQEKELQMREGTLMSFSEIKKISMSCLLNNKEDPRVKTRENTASSMSIHYDFSGDSKANRIRYSDRIDNDLKVRNMSIEGRLSERQKRLHERMIEEHKVQQLAEEIEVGKTGQVSAFFHVLFNPPCVLHMHMRIAIKIVSTLLHMGLENALAGDLDAALCRSYTKGTPSQKQRFEKYINELERIMNTSVLGDSYFPTTWKAPIDYKERKFYPLTMDNQRCKRCIANIKVLVNFCVLDEGSIRQKFLSAVQFFEATMALLCKKDQFSNEEIEEFQDLADHFCQKWIALTSLPGMTNYIHMLASGHMSEYLFRHRNLYVYSNQGWEALNALVKQVYFRRTQRGGTAGRSGKRSRLRGIAYWLQRRLVFMVIDSEKELLKFLEKVKETHDFFDNVEMVNV